MAAWLIIRGSGLDDWIYWRLLLQSLLITVKYKNSQSVFNRTLLPWLLRTHSCSHSTTDWTASPELNWTVLTLISSRHEPRTENTALLLLRAYLLGFPCDRYPASPLARWLLPSSGLGVNHIVLCQHCWKVHWKFNLVKLKTSLPGWSAESER
jgi:hypothetical protein